MKQNKDILDREELRKRPYSVPSDYFEGLQSRLMAIPQEQGLPQQEEVRKPAVWMRIRPYVSLAASFALVLAIGTLALRRPASDMEDSTYEQLLFADMIPHVDPYSFYGDDQEDTELSSEELLDYLVSSNIQPDLQDLTIE